MFKVMLVYGTRPEAIKMAPIIRALEASSQFTPTVAVTGQHRAMLDQVNSLFDIRPTCDLGILRARQDLTGITVRVLQGLAGVFEELKPDVVLVQGDTTTSFAAALAAYYRRIPVFHVEAGLRTGDPLNPYPEEMNRRLVSKLAALHLAPTSTSCANLLAEGVDRRSIIVTGNTVIDSLLDIVARDLPAENPVLEKLEGRRSVLVTAHRRESWGQPMARTGRAIAHLARKYPDVLFLLPAHLNPVVREDLLPPLSGLTNVLVSEPLGYADFAHAMHSCDLVVTDSGGVQEEAPSLGKPVLVLRDTTERPEAVAAGTVRLVGTNQARIISEVQRLLEDPTAYEEMANAVNPYGDGLAASRIVASIESYFGLGPGPIEFQSTGGPHA